MRTRLPVLLCFLLFLFSLPACARMSTLDASVTDASASDAGAVADAVATSDAPPTDANVVCVSLSRPTGSCDLERGACCESSTQCLSGFCRYPGWMCSGDLGYCIDRQDCCNSRHSCIDNLCQY